MVPALLRSGFRFRWRWGGDRRLLEAGHLMLWAVAYVLVSQAGYIVITNIASDNVAGGITLYAFASLLFQLPYGIIGVSILTAIMPRMSRHAAAGQYRRDEGRRVAGEPALDRRADPDRRRDHRAGRRAGHRRRAVRRGHPGADRHPGQHPGRARARPGPVRGDAGADAGVLRDEGRPHPDPDQRDHGRRPDPAADPVRRPGRRR